MSGYGRGSGFASRTAGISRQFTDSERVVDERVDNLLQGTPIHINMRAGLSYSLQDAEKQIAARQRLGAMVNQQQQMSYAQSGRHALADQAVQDDNDKLDANDAGLRIGEMIQSGIEAGDAIYEEISANPNLIHTDHGRRIIDSYKTFGKTEEQKRRDSLKDDLDVLTMKNQVSAAEFSSENMDLIQANQEAKLNVEALTLSGQADDLEYKAGIINELRKNEQTKFEIDKAINLDKLNRMPQQLELDKATLENEITAAKEWAGEDSQEVRNLQRQLAMVDTELKVTQSEEILNRLNNGDPTQQALALKSFVGVKDASGSEPIDPEEINQALKSVPFNIASLERATDEQKAETVEAMKRIARADSEEERKKGRRDLIRALSGFASPEDSEVVGRVDQRKKARDTASLVEPFTSIEGKFLGPSMEPELAFKELNASFVQTRENLLAKVSGNDSAEVSAYIHARFNDITKLPRFDVEKKPNKSSADFYGWLAENTVVQRKDAQGKTRDKVYRDPGLPGGNQETGKVYAPLTVLREARRVAYDAAQDVEKFKQANPAERELMIAKMIFEKKTTTDSVTSYTYKLPNGQMKTVRSDLGVDSLNNTTEDAAPVPEAAPTPVAPADVGDLPEF